jgi:diacylglycerol kinase family enzyme
MIGIISNPNAKSVLDDPTLPERLSRLGGKNALVVSTRDQAEVERIVSDFAQKGVDVVAACGGDGTNLSVLTEMIKKFPPLGLPRFASLRGGTVNTIASNLGIQGSPEDILARLLLCRSRGMVEPIEVRPLLSINERHGFFFAGAMASRFFSVYYGGPSKSVGRASLLAARVTMSSIFNTPLSKRIFEPMKAKITVDGEVLPHDSWTLLVAATLMNVGLNIRITYRAMERPGHFQLIASGLPPSRLARQFHKTFLARPLEGENHFDRLCREVTIEFCEDQEYILDGEFFSAERVVLKIGPQVRFSVP